MEAYERFEMARQEVGDSAILDELVQYMSTDDLEEFCEAVEDAFDLRYFRGRWCE